MNRLIGVIIIVAIGAVGAYFYFGGPKDEGTATTDAEKIVTEVTEATQKAIDFCKEKGGTVEAVTAAEGVTHLCAMADGTKVEVGQYMTDNKTE